VQIPSFISQNDSSTEGDLALLMTTEVVPAASKRSCLPRLPVFALVHAIIFNAPLMMVKVEPVARAPLQPPQSLLLLPAPPARLEGRAEIAPAMMP